ncbi:hypothetical protein Syun_008570 [Stephania yunnanensis]|uniref:Uncharacterized protein n=1 Tax=Stephania yunnanensis TaxID=152371 RepID=A0AAP0KCU2_9MAGN
MATDSGAATRPMAGQRCGSTSTAALGGAGSNASEQAAASVREMVGSAAMAGECGDATQRGEMAASAVAGGGAEERPAAARQQRRWRCFDRSTKSRRRGRGEIYFTKFQCDVNNLK